MCPDGTQLEPRFADVQLRQAARRILIPGRVHHALPRRPCHPSLALLSVHSQARLPAREMV